MEQLENGFLENSEVYSKAKKENPATEARNVEMWHPVWYVEMK